MEYNKLLCDEVRKNIGKELDTVNSRLDKHGEEIDQLKENHIVLTGILKVITDHYEKVVEETSVKVSFWDTKNGEKLFNTILVSALLILGTSVGINIIDYFQ